MRRFVPVGVAVVAALTTMIATTEAALGPFLSQADYYRAIELYHSILSERTPGLLAEPVDYADIGGPHKCVPGRAPRTHAVLVGVSDIGVSDRLIMKGTTNDVELLRSLLIDRGVEEARIHVLLEDDARRDKVVAAFRDVVAQAGCEDRVIVHFSTHAMAAGALAEGTIFHAADTVAEPVLQKLFEADLIRDTAKRIRAEVLEKDAPGELGNLVEDAAALQLGFGDDLAILLDDDSETYNELIRGRDISDFMVAVRNRGAHAVASLDVMDSALARIEERQAEAGDQSTWSFQYKARKSDYWPPAALETGHGSYTVLYCHGRGRNDAGVAPPARR